MSDVKTDMGMSLRVYFDYLGREPGYEDDVKFEISDPRAKNDKFRMFNADTVSFSLTADQAEKLSETVRLAAAECRETPLDQPLPNCSSHEFFHISTVWRFTVLCLR